MVYKQFVALAEITLHSAGGKKIEVAGTYQSYISKTGQASLFQKHFLSSHAVNT